MKNLKLFKKVDIEMGCGRGLAVLISNFFK